jgi:hypothetical protein
MALDDIIRVCPPPEKPVQIPDTTHCTALESDLGITLPQDYKAFLARYGSGCFGAYEADGFFDLAYVLSPAAPDDKHGQSALRWMKRLSDDIHAIQQRFAGKVPHPTGSAPGALVYVGGTTTQHCFYWRTVGAPDAWTIVACDRYCKPWFEWGGDITSFLAAMVERRVPDWLVSGPTRFPLVFTDIATLENVGVV